MASVPKVQRCAPAAPQARPQGPPWHGAAHAGHQRDELHVRTDPLRCQRRAQSLPAPQGRWHRPTTSLPPSSARCAIARTSCSTRRHRPRWLQAYQGHDRGRSDPRKAVRNEHRHHSRTSGPKPHASVPVNGLPSTPVETVEHEAMAYRAWGTPEGDFLARQMDRLAQFIRWTGTTTPDEHEAAWKSGMPRSRSVTSIADYTQGDAAARNHHGLSLDDRY